MIGFTWLARLLARLRRQPPDGQDARTLRLALTAKLADQQAVLRAKQIDLREVNVQLQSLAMTGIVESDRVNEAILQDRVRHLKQEVTGLGSSIVLLQRWIASLSPIETSEHAVVPWEIANRIQDRLHDSASSLGVNVSLAAEITADLDALASLHGDVLASVTGEPAPIDNLADRRATRNARLAEIEERYATALDRDV